MPLHLATYDLERTNPGPHAEFIKQAATVGWSTWILSKNGKHYHLPNTTLVGNFVDINAAKTAFFQAASLTVAQGYKCNVEKWIITAMGANVFNSDVST